MRKKAFRLRYYANEFATKVIYFPFFTVPASTSVANHTGTSKQTVTEREEAIEYD